MKPTLYMAPILGVTNCIYRQTYVKHFSGFDVAVTPFISTGSKVSKKQLKDIIEPVDSKMRIVPQILGNNPNDFINLANAIYELGYKEVNWNLGCPILKIRRKKRGSGLLKYPDLIDDFLSKVSGDILPELSVKVRLGSEEPGELLDLLPILNSYKLKEIIIHPRTGIQMYKGEIDLDMFEECLKVSKHAIVYNGDINSLLDFEVLKKRFKLIKSWMIGRGAITNPFLPEQIRNNIKLNNDEKIIRFLAFHDEIFSTYVNRLNGPGHIMDKIKELWFYWYKAFSGGNIFYKEMCRIRSNDIYLKHKDHFFKEKPEFIV